MLIYCFMFSMGVKRHMLKTQMKIHSVNLCKRFQNTDKLQLIQISDTKSSVCSCWTAIKIVLIRSQKRAVCKSRCLHCFSKKLKFKINKYVNERIFRNSAFELLLSRIFTFIQQIPREHENIGRCLVLGREEHNSNTLL